MRNIAGLAVILITSASVSLGQEGAASRPAPKLPVVSFAQPFDEKDAIVVILSRATPAEPATRPVPDTAAWRISVSKREFTLDKKGLADLKEHLWNLGKKRPGRTEASPSERALLIQADADAPYGHAQSIVEAAAAARIYKISIAVATSPGGVPGAFDCWLPLDTGSGPEVGEIIDEIRVLLAWNSHQSKLERLFGQIVVPPTPEGDQKLEMLIKDSREGYAKRGNPDVPLILDSGPRVPWQSVVEIMDMAKRAGVKKIEFGVGTAIDK